MDIKIQASHVNKIYRTDKKEGTLALDDVSFEIKEGEFVCMLGPSGCGKTTMLNMIGGFENPSSGAVKVAGQVVSDPGPDRGYVFQEHALFPWLKVGDNVGFGLLRDKSLSKQKRQEIVDYYLNMVNLSEFSDKYPHQLSGGMKQRVAISRALAPNPEVLLMDEPFAALDAQTRYMMQLELIKIHQRSQKTIVFVTHGVDEALVLADRILVFSRRPGRIILDETIDIEKPRDVNEPKLLDIKARLFKLLEQEGNYHMSVG
ncbi:MULTISPECIES: ABC transporter ATP-binding protein [unclassified Paenibacillus]|uniref:ABC transporter ATP-binding protein n=1 Tax=unclassified Paenibacillus TaxID=185978 RepID=UPI001AEB5B0E|nr:MULTISPECIES: ABC transporter ATP-binding protein [unclassified Paenibacillus]MBP1154484.1 NitT/TauT family transport system ATP-binding protein [Paenibacillus sp. PvP091]MBP1170132.1 NitT/TauT family transport system ATP-binding protein [Paenibacillus sp. PvR098]MBP2441160.1 NitT/TauT family transport system ATP-binding protein [Paenibacillus sp. PvP052]